jgi:hypothetical protein
VKLSFDVFGPDVIADAQVTALLGKRCSDYALSIGDAMVELNRCAAGGRPRVTLADRWFGHRYDVPAGKSPCTPNETLADAEAIRGCARMLAGVGKKAPHTSILLQTLYMYRGRQAARQFPIHVARDIYLRYSRAGAAVLDPCAGWGGRLLGWLTALHGGSYLGVDACAQSVAGFERMIADLNIPRARVQHGAFEDVSLEPEAFDFAFTSPPYFNVERYSDDAEQSCVRYTTYDAWTGGFLSPLVRNTLAALKPGSAFVLNVSNAGKHKIAHDVIDIAQSAGADVETRADINVGGPGSNMNTSVGVLEDLLVLRKRGTS